MRTCEENIYIKKKYAFEGYYELLWVRKSYKSNYFIFREDITEKIGLLLICIQKNLQFLVRVNVFKPDDRVKFYDPSVRGRRLVRYDGTERERVKKCLNQI